MTTESQRPEILIVAPLLPSLVESLERTFKVHKLWQAADRAAWIKKCGGSIRGMATSGTVGADAVLINALPNLEIISSFGVGVDAIDLQAAQRRGILVTNTPNVLSDCVADTALALILAVSRRICEADRFVRGGHWLKQKFPLGSKVGGKTCAIVGMGNIGQAIAVRAAAFGMNICYHGPRSKPDVPFQYYEDLAQMARDADFLVLALPGGDKTYHLIDNAILNALGPKGILINIARGSVVDQPTLVDALLSGRIGGAGLDVFEDEPHIPSELFALDNVVLLPHLSSGTVETRNAMGELTFANLHAYFTGQPVLTRVV